MKLKNILLTGLSFVLVTAVAVGGTIAYLTSEDSDVNVMTLGNVKIDQFEMEREVDADGEFVMTTSNRGTGYKLKEFVQDKPLYPATEVDANGNPYNFGAGDWDDTIVYLDQDGADSAGYMQVFDSELAVDKFVFVKNTGKTDAYVRTLIALEAGSITDAVELDSLIRISNHFTWDDLSEVGFVEIEGNNYFVIEFVYKGYTTRHANGVLPAGETSYPSLSQVYMTSAATNEDCDALDGNDNGKYDILVLSQAVQAAGFDNAETALNEGFGESTVASTATWFEAMLVARNTITATTPEELLEAFENAQPGMTINADGVTLVPTGDPNNTVNVPAGVTVKGVTFAPTTSAFLRINDGAPVVFEDCDFPGGSWATYLIGTDGCKDVTFKNCDFKGFLQPNGTNHTDAVFTYENCTFGLSDGTGYVNCMGGTHIFNDCTFDYTGGSTMGSNQYTKWNAVNSYSESRFATSVTLNNCTLVNCSTYKVGPSSTLTVQ